jgi:hypothetical protein
VNTAPLPALNSSLSDVLHAILRPRRPGLARGPAAAAYHRDHGEHGDRDERERERHAREPDMRTSLAKPGQQATGPCHRRDPG